MSITDLSPLLLIVAWLLGMYIAFKLDDAGLLDPIDKLLDKVSNFFDFIFRSKK